MAWSKGVYVATINLGVYYTDDFVNPSTQPTWTAVNTGLANVGCREFKLDPFDAENKQYVLTGSDRILYRRDNQGSWASILTPAEVDTLVSTSGCTIGSFCVDESIAGRIWALVGSPTVSVTPNGYWALKSDDYGENWAAVTKIVNYFGTYEMGVIRAYGDNVFVGASVGLGAPGDLYYSTNGGSSWSNLSTAGAGNYAPHIFHNPNNPTRIYYVNGSTTIKYVDAGSPTTTNGNCDGDSDRMWFDPDDNDHIRSIHSGHLKATEDNWSTVSDIGETDIPIISISKYAGSPGQMLVGMSLSGQDHAVGAMTGEVTTVTGIAGPMPGTSPYTNSIPNTCGGACLDGVQGVRTLGHVYAYGVAMPGYSGADRGTPLAGDRSAWQASDFPERHADDIDQPGGIHHTIGTGENQAASGADFEGHVTDLDNPHEVTKVQVGLGNVANILDKLDATTAPTAGDDSEDGYSEGSRWVDVTNDKIYFCLDPSVGAAVWQEVGAGGGGGGDMLKSTYDTDDDGIVDAAEAVDGVGSAGNNKYYGTDGSGTPGFHGLPADGNVREKLTADRTYYIRTDGSDSNDGLTDTSGGAFLTLQHAWDVVAALDMSTYTVTISVGDGTYTAGLDIASAPVGTQRVVLQGNTSTPSNCHIQPASGIAIAVSCQANIQINGFKLSTTNNHCLFISSLFANVQILNIDWGSAGTGQHIRNYGYLSIVGNCTISGDAAYHALTTLGAVIEASSITITLSGTRAFTTFVEAATGSIQSWYGITFTGSATGTRYSVTMNAIVITYGGGASYFPGSVAGSTATGGQYS